MLNYSSCYVVGVVYSLGLGVGCSLESLFFKGGVLGTQSTFPKRSA